MNSFNRRSIVGHNGTQPCYGNKYIRNEYCSTCKLNIMLAKTSLFLTRISDECLSRGMGAESVPSHPINDLYALEIQFQPQSL